MGCGKDSSPSAPVTVMELVTASFTPTFPPGTLTATGTPTLTATATKTSTPLPTDTPVTILVTATFTVSYTPTVSMTPTVPLTATPSSTVTSTATPTLTSTITDTPTVTFTSTITDTATVTPTATPHLVYYTITVTATANWSGNCYYITGFSGGSPVWSSSYSISGPAGTATYTTQATPGSFTAGQVAQMVVNPIFLTSPFPTITVNIVDAYTDSVLATGTNTGEIVEPYIYF